MSQKNSLMEWILQTKKLQKAEDYMGLSIVDSILDYLWILDKDFVRKHKKMYGRLCSYYHKDNPVDFLTKKKLSDLFISEHDGMTIDKYERKYLGIHGKRQRSSKLYRYLKEIVHEQIGIQLARYYEASDAIELQWCELVDFIWERCELINRDLIMSDPYLIEIIEEVCKKKRKKNPIKDDINEKFGKYWKDANGSWHLERRRRF